MNLIVNAVGDANVICIGDACISCCPKCCQEVCFCLSHSNAVLDYGKNDSDCRHQIQSADTFILSHFHKDHYQGLFDIPNMSLCISRLYYPIVPSIKGFYSKDKVYKLFILSHILGQNFGAPQVDLICFMKQKSRETIKKIKGLKQGDSVCIKGYDYQVIWPPVNPDENFSNSVREKIEEIEKTIKEDSQIREIWDNIRKMELSEPPFSLKYDQNDFIEKLMMAERVDRNIAKNLTDQIGQLANHFSLCLYKKGDFLFLGDLENADIDPCISYLQKHENVDTVKVKYFVTPHHGTHWHDILKKVQADYVISSNGAKLKKYFDDNYCTQGKYHHNTSDNGTFIGRL